MVKKIIGSILINLFAFYLASQVVSSFVLTQDLKSFGVLVLVFTFIHLLIKPLINIVLNPLNFLSLGLVSFVVDIAIFYVLTNFVGNMPITPWTIPHTQVLDLTIAERTFGKLETTIIVASIVSLTRSFLITIFFD